MTIPLYSKFEKGLPNRIHVPQIFTGLIEKISIYFFKKVSKPSIWCH